MIKIKLVIEDNFEKNGKISKSCQNSVKKYEKLKMKVEKMIHGRQTMI